MLTLTHLVLWIVPFGIEICLRRPIWARGACFELYLLELKWCCDCNACPPRRTLNCTFWNWNSCCCGKIKQRNNLWIVPFGIEITYINLCCACFSLWIVPFGIEIILFRFLSIQILALNCTFWNWNFSIAALCFSIQTLNCTFWNWNHLLAKATLFGMPSLNCTFWNWNLIFYFFVRFNCYFELYLLELKCRFDS